MSARHATEEAAAGSLLETGRSMAGAASPEEAMRFLDAGMNGAFGHILFTLLRFDEPSGVMRRIYSNRPEVNPVGGTKPIEDTPWMETVLRSGEPYLGKSKADLRSVFPDYETLWSIGCGSVINVPVRWLGRTVGSINMLGAEGRYGEGDVEHARLFGPLAVPLFI